MPLRPIHDPEKGPLRAVALMSGSGTNLRKILEHTEKIKEREGRELVRVAGIFSDSCDSKANEIGKDFDIPVITHDLRGWLQKNNVERKDLESRREYDRHNLELLKPLKAAIAIYAGYMSIASPELINSYIGVNVHPADLSATDGSGNRKWTGAHAVRDAIAAGEKYIHATTHLVTLEVDAGPVLMISPPLEVEVPKDADLNDPETLQNVADKNQDRLKEAGDWVVFPETIEAIARGWFQTDEQGNVYYKEEPVPEGIRK